jgi:2-dehydropantoate 2-reductase
MIEYNTQRHGGIIVEIRTVSIIGLGALGVLFGNHLSKHMPEDNLRIIANAERIERYRRENIYCNGELCRFNYVLPEEPCAPADLLLFAVKSTGLPQAVRYVKNHVGPNTIILSLLNGISSEEIIGETYGMDKLLYCVAQGMDAVKAGNRLKYKNMGMLCFGGGRPGQKNKKIQAVAGFFEKTSIPHEVVEDMRHKMWGKFMLNVGLNQTVAVFGGDYETVQRPGPARDTMIAAMEEVITLSEKEGVNLTRADLDYWLQVLDKLYPKGKPSMRQDVEARRLTEVELFAGTVLSLGKKHGLTFPVNEMLYDKIKEIESAY